MNEGGHQGGGERTSGPYGFYETDDGRMVIYDERNPDAYVRSDTTVELTR